MQPTKKSGRILGLLFLTSIVVGVAGTSYRGLSGLEFNDIDVFSTILSKATTMKWAIGLDILGSATMVVVALFLLPFIKKYSNRLASGYFGLAVISFVLIVVSNVLHVMLMSLSARTTTLGLDGESILSVAQILYDGYYWIHFLMLALYSIGNSILFYFFFKTKLLPRWLSIWGILASVFVFAGGALQLAEIDVPFALFIQNGIFMLVFTVWLLAMGFSKKSSLVEN